MADEALYSPQIPAATTFSNTDLNELASQYATDYSHDTTNLIRRIVRNVIYDAAPQQYQDLAILNMKAAEQVPSDEFTYLEMGYGRSALITTTLGADIVAGGTQTVPVTNLEAVSVDTMLSGPTNVKAIVTAKSAASGAGNVDIAALNGETLPQLDLGSAYTFANLSTVEADGQDYISQYFRMDSIERSNFVQMFVKALRFGKMELYKYNKAGSTSNYLTLNKEKFIQQFRTDISNVFWNGKKGEVTLANNAKAKLAGGIFPLMQAAGSSNDSVTLANAPAALETLALDTEYKMYGATRFLYAAPRVCYYLTKEFKATNLRYEVGDMKTALFLNSIDIGSSRIVLVPMKRFEEPSCFPADFAKRAFLIDQESIIPTFCFGEEMGDTLARKDQGTLQNYTDTWISATFSIIFNNPLGCGWLDITNI